MDADPFALIGAVLDGMFRVDALVGEGELSVIYKGQHLGSNSPVAIKCLHLPDTLDPALTRPVVEAFEDAGRVQDSAGRGNPHVARTIAAGRTVAPRTGATVPYRVREWFDGESLASDLERRKRSGEKPRTIEEAFSLLAPAIDGIAHAHEEGIAHLSLDPANLFLARKGGSCSLKVLDFGTARTRQRPDARPTLDSEVTRGLHLLHPAYAAPEQLDMDLGAPGPWSDVYALALIFMEVLGGRSDLERGDTAALVKRALDKQKRPTPQAHGLKLPRPLDLVLARAVARTPDGRPKDARLFLNELKAALGHDATPKAQPLRAAPRWVAPAPPPPMPAKAAPVPQAAPEPVRARSIEGAPVVFVAPVPPVPPVPPPAPHLPPTPLAPTPRQPESFPVAPTAAVSGPIVAASEPADRGAVAVTPPASVFHLPAVPLPAPLLADEQPVAFRPFSRARLPLRAGAAALAFAGIVAGVLVLARGRRPPVSVRATAATTSAPSAATGVARAPATPLVPAAAAPMPPPATPAVAPTVADPHPPAEVASEAPATIPHSATHASMIRFSPAAARRAIHPVLRRVERCRRGPFWGNGYATVVFWNDGSVRQVLVDPPFSMTVAGKCVADALHGAHMPSFMGRTGYYRLRFSIAPR